MKKDKHPPYQDVLFVDSSNGQSFVIGTTLQPKEKQMYEGRELPVYRVPISSASHPFFTGSKQFIDSEGRVDKFTKRYKKKIEELSLEQDKQEKAQAEAKAKKKKKK